MTLIDGPRLPPASGGAPKSLVIFLHGYGADGNDLIGLAREWSPILPDTAFVSPHAPEACAMSPAGRQWFDLTMRDPSEYSRGVNTARPELNAFLDSEMEKTGVGPERTAFVGFSQGTMMALHTGLLRESPLAGILGYSGLLADPGALVNGKISRAPVLLIHGDRDDVIPVQALFAATQGLSAAEVPVEWHVSQGVGHGIAPDGLQMGGEFLNLLLTH